MKITNNLVFIVIIMSLIFAEKYIDLGFMGIIVMSFPVILT
jgi:hypothetical protein